MSQVHGPLGATTWLIPDGYLPTGSADGFDSHEAFCVLNTGAQRADLEVWVYLEDDEPVGPVRLEIPARRTRHVRVDGLTLPDGRSVPRDVPYAAVVRSDVPVTVQYSRMDMRSPAMALATTMAHPV